MDNKSDYIAPAKKCGKLCLSLLAVIVICIFSAVFLFESSDSSVTWEETATVTTTKEVTIGETSFSQAALTLTSADVPLSEPDNISAPYAGLYEASTFTAIYKKEADKKIHPASLAKILTAVTALTYVPPETVFTVGSEQDLVPERSSLCLIKKGHRLKLHDLLAGMLIASGNDAAYTVAVNTARSVNSNENMSDKEALTCFSALMNTAAVTAGAHHSHFVTPDGFDEAEQYTTIEDLAAICRYALTFKEIRDIVKCSEKHVVFESGENVTWKNSNQLLNPKSSYYFSAATGMKTGTTPLAGKCLIGLADINDKTYIAVVAGCDSEESRYNSVLNLFFFASSI